MIRSAKELILDTVTLVIEFGNSVSKTRVSWRRMDLLATTTANY